MIPVKRYSCGYVAFYSHGRFIYYHISNMTKRMLRVVNRRLT